MSIVNLINPDLLVWARKTIGYDVNEAAKKIKVNTEDLLSWENGTVFIPIKKLKVFSEAYKRPSAVFLLDKVPDDKSIKEFRSLFETLGTKIDLTKDTLLAFRRANRIQRILEEEIGLPNNSFISQIRKFSKFDNDDETLATNIGNLLGVDYEKITKSKTIYEALNYWKKLFEERQIVVLEMGFPRLEARGFLLQSDKVPIIVLNTKDTPHARIFTLLHELGHLILGRNSIDNKSTLTAIRTGTTDEINCNHFAGALSAPKKLLTEKVEKEDIDFDFVEDMARYFKLSREVITRRLFTIGLIDHEKYIYIIKEIKRNNEEISRLEKEKNKKNNGGNYYINFIKNNSSVFINEVFKAYDSNRITYNDALNYLNTKPKIMDNLGLKLPASII